MDNLNLGQDVAEKVKEKIQLLTQWPYISNL